MARLPDQRLMLEAYNKAGRRILFLDYDGTLVPFNDLPEKSVLGDKVRKILVALSLDPKNQLYIISGRDRNFLASQFNGTRIGLIAEHGYCMREAEGEWKLMTSVDLSWKHAAIEFCVEFAISNPGTFIEEKETAIAFHYRTAEKEAGTSIRPGFSRKFQLLHEQYPGLELLDGDKVLEIKPAQYNKGSIAAAVLQNGSFDFILAAGDDITDEWLFRKLPPGSFTIKIGLLRTAAEFYNPTRTRFIRFLRSFCSC